jgi:ATP-dependent Clp protease ATP-binding subunit ClpB
MTDGHGRTVDFKNTIIIMTSNVGSRWIQELSASSREEMEDRVTEALRASFKPEFLNRIDEIIIFHNLTQEQIGDIVDIQMKRLKSRLAEMNMELVLSDKARAYLAEKGFDQIYGARPLKRAIQKYIENPLSMEILKGNISEGTKLRVDVEGEQIVFNPL